MSFPYSIQEIVDAYRDMDIRPVTGTWARYYSDGNYHAKKCGCGLSALIALKHGFDAAIDINEEVDADHLGSDVERVGRLLGLDKSQVAGFMSGFDHGMEWEDHSEARGEDLASFYAGVSARLTINPIFIEDFERTANHP